MKILNFGSLNIDYTYHVPHIAKPGETVSSTVLEVFPGGKGLNQSIALARAGMEVWHAGLIGEDGRFLKELCEADGVHTDYVKICGGRSGNAIIQVSEKGQNSIILFPGANREHTESSVREVLKNFDAGDMLLLQNEINLTGSLIRAGKEKGMTVVLNPSPMDEQIKQNDLKRVDLFFVNEVEGEQITGKKEPEEILDDMKEQFPAAAVVLTLGEKGAFYSDAGERYYQVAVPAKTVDTTAAGDTFTGYFLAAVCSGKTKQEALFLAAKAAACAVGVKGAAVSVPLRDEVW